MLICMLAVGKYFMHLLTYLASNIYLYSDIYYNVYIFDYRRLKVHSLLINVIVAASRSTFIQIQTLIIIDLI